MEIQAGTIGYGYLTPGIAWNLNSGSGERTFTSPDIKFPTPFSTNPTVIVALYGVDAGGGGTALRLTVTASDVEPNEFNAVFQTWGDSVIYSVWVSWIAYTP